MDLPPIDPDDPKLDLVQSISSELFSSQIEFNERIASLDETMLKAGSMDTTTHPFHDDDVEEQQTIVYSTRDAQMHRRNRMESSNASSLQSSGASIEDEEEKSTNTATKGNDEPAGADKVKLPPNLIPPKHRNTSSSISLSGSGKLRHSSTRSASKRNKRSAGRIRASQALVQRDDKTVADAIQMMVERRVEATLLTDANGILSGILTDKDIAVKVVAQNRDPNQTLVAEVMTRNPRCVRSDTKTLEALKTMVSGHFRHLPVADHGIVVGILDITKCLYDVISKIERAYTVQSARFIREVDRLEKQFGEVGDGPKLFETMREKLFMPTLSVLLREGEILPKVFATTTALRASEIMLEQQCSAVVVYDEHEEPVGIFTTKDLMRRALAAHKNPSTCLVQEVMTPNPEYATLDTAIVDALHLMHDGKFLHLPVKGRNGKVVGLTDVLEVTYGVVDQLGSFHHSTTPIWKKFLQSSLESESVDSTAESLISLESCDDYPSNTTYSTTLPPAMMDTSDDRTEIPRENYPNVFVYKMIDTQNHHTHRFTSSADSVDRLFDDVKARLNSVDLGPLQYVDDEGDFIILFTDSDLKDAVITARALGKCVLRLVLSSNEKMMTLSTGVAPSSSCNMSETSSVRSVQDDVPSSTSGSAVSQLQSYTTLAAAAGAAAALVAGVTVVMTRRN